MVTATDVIARVTAERSSPYDGSPRHRWDAVLVTNDVTARRGVTRRLAPLAVGAAVMLVAAAVAAVVRPADDRAVAGPELSSAIVENRPAPVDIVPAAPTSDGTPRTASATPAPATGRKPTPARPAPVTGAAPSAGATVAAGPPPVAARAAAAPAAGGVQAATLRGWTLVGGDEFNGNAIGPTWGVYEGAGNGGNGRRTADALSVANGLLTIRGDKSGNTGGLAWNDDQRFGKWEIRARFPKGDAQYHPVLILWPKGAWPAGGEVDFAETDSAATDVGFFLHFSSSNQQKSATQTLDLTQWHNYAVDWVAGSITGYIDGKQWFQSTDAKTLPPDKMHATIQLDYFPDDASATTQPSEMDVDYMRIYS